MFLPDNSNFGLIEEEFKDHPLFNICKKLTESNELIKKEKFLADEKVTELQELYQRQLEENKVKELTNRVKELTQLEVQLTTEEIAQVTEIKAGVQEINNKIQARSLNLHVSSENFSIPKELKSFDNLNQPSFGGISNGDIVGITDIDESFEIFNNEDMREVSGFMEMTHHQNTLLDKTLNSNSLDKAFENNDNNNDNGDNGKGVEFNFKETELSSKSESDSKLKEGENLPYPRESTPNSPPSIKVSLVNEPESNQLDPEPSKQNLQLDKELSNANSFENNELELKDPFEQGVVTMDLNDLDIKKSNIKGGAILNLSQVLEEKINELKVIYIN
ncbi:hypothetical protein CONCODRAFT_91878 [Conidiobolus coronatus NRRL 28638]|uniref:Uncharacterized protein n=1 Tax=Conidiobolus coronatus (strain ATCC 28846 / CBS 209.66 / NRRL 28638) TaxID=796925 RepID=A0A137P426_CONC2|nr:hypothetical protein CONCODRAFT_91878 [Conidiobolus coronatus NRRL 28638]|eukprot:KXN69780.1 hypothetical protein CONCODRAFT_91878 [Conidiobolus coronatus NRRL 28638]